MVDDHIKPPKTIEEVGIHIGYMRDDISELKDLVKAMPNGFATKTEMSELAIRVTRLENRHGVMDTLRWVALSVTSIVAILGIYDAFRPR